MVYGIDHKVEELTQQEVLKSALKLKIDASELYFMDSSFAGYLNDIDTSLWLFEKNNYQPLQYKVFNRQGKLISQVVNCDAGGFPNLKWDWMFNQFPPTVIENKFGDLLALEEYSSYFTPLPHYKRTDSSKYTVVVVWSDWMGRQNKRFLQKVKDIRSANQKVEVDYLYVNFDNVLYRLTR